MAPAVSAQQFYEFEIVAQEGDTVGGLAVSGISAARINDSGDIAFSGGAPGSVSAVWSMTSVLLAEGQGIGGGVILPDFRRDTFAFNNAGVAAVSSSGFGGDGVFTSNGTAITPGTTIDGATISGNFDVNVALSNNGDLVFIADVETAPGVFTTTVFNSNSVLAQEGQTIAGIALTDIGSIGINGLLGVDNSGNAAFFNNADFFNPGEIGVVSTAGFGLETQSPFPSGPLAGQNILSLSTASFALAVNGQGSILLEANVDQVGGLYTQDGLVVANGVIDGVDGFFFGAADLNDDGTYVSNFSDFNTINGFVVNDEIVITDLDTIEGFDIDSLLNGGPVDLNNNGDF
ncbi:MAG: hypothetical protein AAGH88_15775, partial [Planctomycetota bacterium]